MDSKGNVQGINYSGSGARIQTQAIKVMITTDDFEIEGFMHIKPGGYQSRVSDLLNAKGQQYVPLTQVTYRNLHHPGEQPRTAETMILRIDTIKMVIPQSSPESGPAGL